MIVAFDPSGNFKEGLGTTGVCLMSDEGEVLELREIKATSFKSPEAYWDAHIDLLRTRKFHYTNLEVVMEGFRLYAHKSNTQIQSEFETSQLIGVIRHWCFVNDVPLKIQYAPEVKTRWKEEILVKAGYLEPGNKFKGKQTSTHKRDALKHALRYFHHNRGQ